ncbi:MAG: MBL fold metallo-hydrolase [archaeon]
MPLRARRSRISMNSIRVTPIAYESLGVRSSCVLVETKDVAVLVDAGVSLAPRFSLMPHPKEYKTRALRRKSIRDAAEKADVITLSHCHQDHYTPNFVDTVWLGSSKEEARAIYSGKTVLMKDWRSHVNSSQRRRGWLFQKTAGPLTESIEVVDGKRFAFGKTELRFSPPLFHGEDNSELGWVIMLIVQTEDEKFLHASDVQGPMLNTTMDLILKERPDVLAIGGPPLYLSGSKVPETSIQRGYDNLKMIVSNVATTILDHHLLRDENWRSKSSSVFDSAASAGNSVVTAAKYAGSPNMLLENQRRLLYEMEPPSEEFVRWSGLPRDDPRKLSPPV